MRDVAYWSKRKMIDVLALLFWVASGLFWGSCDTHFLESLFSDIKLPDKQEVKEPARQVMVGDAEGKVEGKSIPAGDLRDEGSLFELAIYLPDATAEKALKKAKKLVGNQMEDVVWGKVEKAPAHNVEVLVRTPGLEDYKPPGADDLQYGKKGVDEKMGKALENIRSVLVLVFYSTSSHFHDAYRGATKVIYQLAVDFNGFPWDENTRQLFTPDAWKERRFFDSPPLNISRHITIHAYRENDFIRMVTLGMEKFGLPDVVAENVSGSDTSGVGNVINLTCQILYEQHNMGADSTLLLDIATLQNKAVKEFQLSRRYEASDGKYSLPVRYVTPDEGDADNRLLALVFPGETPQTGHADAIRALYGIEDEVTNVDADLHRTRAVKKARANAMKKLLEIKPRFIRDRQVGEQLLVKAPFATDDGGTEWMWVEVVSWNGKIITGVLQNEPYYIKSLKAGARVEVSESELFDYIHRLGKKETGNETSKLLFD